MTLAVHDTFAALAEPHRCAIVELLRDGEHLPGHVSAILGLSQPSVSKHLKVLREAGLVDVRTDAQRRWYRLRSDPLQNIDRWLSPYRRIWNQRLDALEQYLDGQNVDEHTIIQGET